jgi:hypothetical protein
MQADLDKLVSIKNLRQATTKRRSSKLQATLTIKKVQGDQQIVTGEVYAPYVIDSHGEMMLPEDIVKLAHRTLLNSKNHSIDVMHDNKQIKASIVESYIAKKNDPDYAEGAWVLSIKIMDDNVWAMIKAGKLNGYSLEAMVYKYEADVVYDYLSIHYGVTEENDGHFHSFIVKVDEEGRVIGGSTSEAEDEDGVTHSHRIRAGTATRASNKHSHRYFLNEID